uniref:Uncharacterized protein n=1 Tax=Sinocyclocheilus anshuiensis TaxID=1608454 RepID=A0A671KTV7_9TELE
MSSSLAPGDNISKLFFLQRIIPLSLLSVAHHPGGNKGDLALCRPCSEGPEVYSLVCRATMQAEVKILVVLVLHRIHNLLWHPHRKGEVAANLPNYNSGADIACLDLHVLSRHLLYYAKSIMVLDINTLKQNSSRGKKMARKHLKCTKF